MADGPELRFDDRVVVITGAGGGLGRQHALLLASRGARVVVNDLGGAVDGSGTSETAAALVVDEIRAAGGQAVADFNTVATPEGGEATIQRAINEFGRVDVLVNNAGILRDRGFHNMTDELVRPVLDVHLLGAFNVTRPAWRHMRAQGEGCVINTTSSAGLLGNAGQANYAAAKMGLVGLTRALAVEGRRHGIRVNAVAPLARSRMTEEAMGQFADAVDPIYVSALVAALADPSSKVTGKVFSVGGGRIARFVIGLTESWFDPAQARDPEVVAEKVLELEHDHATTELDDAIEEIRLIRRLVFGRPADN